MNTTVRRLDKVGRVEGDEDLVVNSAWAAGGSVDVSPYIKAGCDFLVIVKSNDFVAAVGGGPFHETEPCGAQEIVSLTGGAVVVDFMAADDEHRLQFLVGAGVIS